MTEQTIIVPDSSPLITLAAAGALEVLLKPGLKVRVPDGVFWEATRFVDKLGAREIIDWAAANEDQVHIAVTHRHQETPDDVLAAAKRLKNHGEQCTQELVERLADRDPPTQSILIYEDGDVTLLSIVNTDKIAIVTTASFLDEMERCQYIQSADQILDEAVAKGRREGVRVRNEMHAKHLLRQNSGQGW